MLRPEPRIATAAFPLQIQKPEYQLGFNRCAFWSHNIEA